MLWPRLSPERSCVCCRSRRRLGRLRARPASHCKSRSRSLSLSERTEKRYQNERRSRLLAASSYCATGIDLFGILPLRSFPSARTDQDGPQWVTCGRQIRPWTDFAPSPGSAFRFQSGVQGRGPLGLQYINSGRLLRANSGHSRCLADGLITQSAFVRSAEEGADR